METKDPVLRGIVITAVVLVSALGVFVHFIH